ncbi:TPA: hypothetical protein ACSRD7_004233 [Yersinia enterocolitica]|nr:hypothetical protein [Yersinia enterocolitica]HEN3309616.1 hypothetical protein [Yersinia enterocolitica]
MSDCILFIKDETPTIIQLNGQIRTLEIRSAEGIELSSYRVQRYEIGFTSGRAVNEYLYASNYQLSRFEIEKAIKTLHPNPYVRP